MYTFENGFKHKIEIKGIESRQEIEEKTEMLEHAASYIFYLSDHIPGEYMCF